MNDYDYARFDFVEYFNPTVKVTRPSRPIRCDVWIVERMRYPTDRPTNRPTDTASYRGDLSHPKNLNISTCEGVKKNEYY